MILPRTPFLFLFFLLLCLSQADAQEAVPVLERSEVDAALADLEAIEEMDDELRESIRTRLSQALEQLDTVGPARTRALEAENLRKSSADDVQKLTTRREELQKLDPPTIDLPPDEDVGVLEQRRDDARAALGELQLKLRQLEEELKTRAARRAETAARLPELREELGALESAVPTEGLSPEAQRAENLWRRARAQAVRAEIAALEAEGLAYDPRRELLMVQRDIAELEMRRAEEVAARWREAVSNIRRARANARLVQERKQLRQLKEEGALEEVVAVAEANVALAQLRAGADGLIARIDQARAELATVRARTEQMRTNDAKIQEKVKAAGLTQAIGLLLARERAEMPDARFARSRVNARRAQIAAVHFGLLERQDESSTLLAVDEQVRQDLAEINPNLPPELQEPLERRFQKLYVEQRELLGMVIADEDALFEGLIELSTAETELIQVTEALSAYISERILWVQSGEPLGWSSLEGLPAAAGELVSPGRLSAVLAILRTDMGEELRTWVLAVLFYLFLIYVWRRLKRRWDAANFESSSPLEPVILGLLPPICLAFLVVSPVWFLVARMEFAALQQLSLSGVDKSAPKLVMEVVQGLDECLLPLFLLAFLRRLMRPNGLAARSFGWDLDFVAWTRAMILFFILPGLPLWFVTVTIEAQGDPDARHSLGRLCLILLMLLMASLFFLLVRKARKLGKEKEERAVWARLPMWVYVGGPLALVGATFLGYHFTAVELAGRLHQSALLVISAFVVRSLVLAGLGQLHPTTGETASADPEDALIVSQGVAAVTSQDSEGAEQRVMQLQTRRLLDTTMGLLLVAGLYGIWVSVLPALGFLQRIELWERVVESAEGGQVAAVTTAADLCLALLLIVFTVVAVQSLPGLIDAFLLRGLRLDAGARFAYRAVTGYALGIAGIMAAFGAIGIGWGEVQWLVAAVSVGLGFGLQEIFANFISGLIMLFERPVRVGDTVTINGVSGKVMQIRIRATTIRDFDCRDIVVPNRAFITGDLTNWDLSDRTVRFQVPVGITYDSDAEQALLLMLRCARADRAVLRDPRPRPIFREFGDSSLVLVLYAYANSDQWWDARHRLHLAIRRSFREAGIEMAFPQLDVHVKHAPPEVVPTERGLPDEAPGRG